MLRRPLFLTAAAVALSFASFAARAGDETPPAPAAEPAHEGAAFEAGTPAFADVLAKAKAAGKPVFIDFSTEWCGWCKKLDKEVFSQATVGEAMKAFVNVHVDAEKGEGVDLAKRYGVSSYPTLVVVDATGEEIDRISGFMPTAPFIKEVGRIAKGDGTLGALKESYTAAPDDVNVGIAYATKLGVGNPEKAEALWGLLADQAKMKNHDTQGAVALGRTASRVRTIRTREEATEVAGDVEAFMKDFADTPAAGQAAAKLGQLLLMTDPAKTLTFLDAARGQAKEAQDRIAIERTAVMLHRGAIAASLKRQADAAGDDAQVLNEVAWTCFEQKVNVKAAIGWAKTAVEKSNRDGAILDTLANLLWLTGKHDEALKLEEEAAGKADGAMKKEFVANVAKWKAELSVVKKSGEKEEADDDEEGDEGDEGSEK